VLCLLVLTILIVVVFQLGYTTKVNLRLAKNRLDRTVLQYAYLGAIVRAKEYLTADASENEWDSLSDLWATVQISADEGADEYGYGYDYDYARDPWVSDEEDEMESRVDLEVVIVDEDRKLNLSLLREKPQEDEAPAGRGAGANARNPRNADNRQDRETPNMDRGPTNKLAEEKIRERVFEGLVSILAEFREGTAWALTGGEARDLATKIRDYVVRPKKRNTPEDEIPTPDTVDYPLLTTDELLQIPGMTEEILYDFVDPEDETRVIPGLLNFVTIWSSGLVNVNTAPEIVLRSIFEREDRNRAADIVEYRDSSGEEGGITERSGRVAPPSERDEESGEEEATPGVFKEVSELQNTVLDNDSYQSILPFLTTRSSVFSVHVIAKRGKMTLHQRTVFRRVGGEVHPLFTETRRDRPLWGREERGYEEEASDGFLF